MATFGLFTVQLHPFSTYHVTGEWLFVKWVALHHSSEPQIVINTINLQETIDMASIPQ